MNKGLIMMCLCLVFALGVSSSPVQAQDQQNYANLQLGGGRILPVSAAMEGFHTDHILDMSVKHALAILLGVGAGMYIAENFMPFTLGVPPELVGVLLGGLIGNWWYKNHMPPFG